MGQIEFQNKLDSFLNKPISRRNLLKTGVAFGTAAVLDKTLGPVLDLGTFSKPKEAHAEDATIDLLPEAMKTLWRKTDGPVASGASQLSWLWGNKVLFITDEMYDGALRKVAYFDKSRMDLNPDPNAQEPWKVRNGLLVKEMVTGQMQTGDAKFEPKGKPNIKIVGDKVPENPSPTYAEVDQYLYPQTQTTFDAVAPEFQPYLNSFSKNYADAKLDWLFVTGYPISKPFWTKAMVGGQTKDVMVQLFERRALTFTPSNEGKWQIEMANAGQDYYTWRYERRVGQEIIVQQGNGWEIVRDPNATLYGASNNIDQLDSMVAKYMSTVTQRGGEAYKNTNIGFYSYPELFPQNEGVWTMNLVMPDGSEREIYKYATHYDSQNQIQNTYFALVDWSGLPADKFTLANQSMSADIIHSVVFGLPFSSSRNYNYTPEIKNDISNFVIPPNLTVRGN